MSAIRVVLCDIGNVLVRASHDITYAILRDYGVQPDKVPLFFHGEAYREFARGRIYESAFAKAVAQQLDVPLTQREVREAHDAHMYAVDRAVANILTHVQRALPRPMTSWSALAFVTTSNPWQSERVRDLIDLAERLGPVVDSWRLGMTKTDQGAWDAILEKLNFGDVARSSILFIDDSHECIAAAREYGLRTHLYNPAWRVGSAALRQLFVAEGLPSPTC